jgi:S-adenosylmethionine:tRNA ribosyltransferase-isomerase
MKVDLFDFELPPESIALRPADPRDSARLLVAPPNHRPGPQPDSIDDRIVRDLPGLLLPGDLLVVNNTRVIPARFSGHIGEARVEITLHQAVGPDAWTAFVRPAKKFRLDARVVIDGGLEARVSGRGEGGEVTLAFPLSGPDLMAAFAEAGTMPLPPYIARRRAPDARDRDDYQTMFAAVEGSVAAPTAGLHFTPDLLAALSARGVEMTTVTLNVGAGTFLPVKADDTTDHLMHAEYGEVTAQTAAAIAEARARGGRIIAVGTTSLRLLESAAGPDGVVRPFAASTRIFITPGYQFRAVDVLMTNFHLPRSTLFMLVAAFVGLERAQAIYAHAIAAGYRFYSYGDSSLLFRTSQ